MARTEEMFWNGRQGRRIRVRYFDSWRGDVKFPFGKVSSDERGGVLGIEEMKTFRPRELPYLVLS
jgi:hypothetical protein